MTKEEELKPRIAFRWEPRKTLPNPFLMPCIVCGDTFVGDVPNVFEYSIKEEADKLGRPRLEMFCFLGGKKNKKAWVAIFDTWSAWFPNDSSTGCMISLKDISGLQSWEPKDPFGTSYLLSCPQNADSSRRALHLSFVLDNGVEIVEGKAEEVKAKEE